MVRDLAQERWPEVRNELLAHLRQRTGTCTSGQVAILLHEGLLDDAIALANASTHNYTLVEQVVDAVITSHPDWVITVCRQQAEPTMDQGKSKYYHHAARWLGKAQAAYLAAGRDNEWHSYLADLLRQHGRKRSLVPLLEGLCHR